MNARVEAYQKDHRVLGAQFFCHNAHFMHGMPCAEFQADFCLNMLKKCKTCMWKKCLKVTVFQNLSLSPAVSHESAKFYSTTTGHANAAAPKHSNERWPSDCGKRSAKSPTWPTSGKSTSSWTGHGIRSAGKTTLNVFSSM